MPTDSRMLDSFVGIGRDILSCDWAARYGADIARVAPSPPGVGYAQPGFLGREYRGLVFLSQNPGAGADRAEEHRRWNHAFRNWAELGTVAAYLEVFEFWRQDLRDWTVWTQWIAPILERLGLTEDHIGYLNLSKNATTGNAPPTVRMYRSDWAWTKRQLEILQPRVVVAGGLDVARRLQAHWPAPPFTVLPQNRARSQNITERDRQADLLAAQIRSALQ